MKIESIKMKGFAISLIAFPVMLLAGFLMHPNLLKLEALQTIEQLVGRFHGQPLYHIGHLINEKRENTNLKLHMANTRHY
jgi:hypothetical protein